jgi:predicted nucleotidyltransferase component of viral defense system
MKKNISKLHYEILNENQLEALKSLKWFKKYGVLGGGTALALQLSHRKSFDLDIFTPKPISKKLIYKAKNYYKNIEVLIDTEDELSFNTPFNVKISFVFYPFKNIYKTIKTPYLDIFSWKDIALDKAYTIGRRGEWRDYVDLYFIIKNGFSLFQIMKGAKRKFGDTFSEKLFLSQLVYYGDIHDFSIEYFKEKPTKEEIQKFFEKEVSKIKI